MNDRDIMVKWWGNGGEIEEKWWGRFFVLVI